MTNANQFLIWKHVPGYVNIQVNQYGQVRDSGTHELKHFYDTNEHNTYYRVRCKAEGDVESKVVYVHTLIMAAFKGERPIGYHIDHKDGNRTNNVLANLHYVTRSQNNRNRRDQVMVIYNGVNTVLIDALEDMFGKDCVSAKVGEEGRNLYNRIKTNIANGKSFDDAIQYEIKKRGWPVPASNE